MKISNHISIGPQPALEMLEELKKKGFKTVVNLSAKGELGQLITPEEEGDKLHSLAMDYLHFPVSLSRLKPSQLLELFETCQSLEGPIYIHCRIGQRAVPFGLLMYAIRKDKDFEDTLARAEKIGLDLTIPSIKMLLKKSIREAHVEECEGAAA